MMHPALWKLYRLRVRGGLRSIGRKLRSVRGALLTGFALLVFGMMIVPNILMAFGLGRHGGIGQHVDSFGDLVSVGMFLYVVLSVVTSLGERAIYFSPSDVDMLFPAPFSRRQLLLYKILGSVAAAVFVAPFFATAMAIHVRSLPAAAAGFFLAYLMVGSVTMCAQLIAQSIGERAFTRVRKLLLAGVIVALAAALGQAAGRGLDGPWQETLSRLRHSAVGEVVLAPFAVFAKIITAERLIPDALGWAALGTIVVVGIYALAIWLDANYLETAVRVSQQIQERKRRMIREGAFATRSKRAIQSTRLRQPPWLGGMGPVLWRQTVQLLRSGRGGFVMIAIIMLAVGAPMVIGAGHNKELLPKILPHFVIGIAAYATFLYSSQAPFGFRGDFGRMDVLKSLPIGSMAMAGGQMLVVTMMMTLLDWLVFAAVAVALPPAAGEMLAAALFVLPFNWILFGVESFLFLLYPSPLVATGSEGFLKAGRVILFMIVKTFVLGGCAVEAGIPAAIVYLLTKSMPAALLVAWIALLLPAVGVLLTMAWAYHRFDASEDARE